MNPIKRWRRAQISFLSLAGLPLLALGQTVNVQVDAGTIKRTAYLTHFGINTTAWDPELGTSRTMDLMADAGIHFVRLPGGSISDEYHWLTNTSRDNAWTWASGFDKSSLGGYAIVTLNYGSGTPEEAAAWVAYSNFPAGLEGQPGDVTIGPDSPAPGVGSVPSRDWLTAGHWANLRAAAPLATDDPLNFLRVGRTVPREILYWEIGNENYGNWEFDLQSPKQSPVTYATRAKAYIEKIHAVDYRAKVGVVVVTGNQYDNWTASMLGTMNTLGVKPDFVIYHRYEQGPGAESDAGLLNAARTWPNDIADIRAQLNSAFGATAAADIFIFITENNSVYTDPGKQSTSLVNGLFLADSIGNVLQTEADGFVWWDLRNGPPANNQGEKPALYGWRTWGDYGILSTPPAVTTPATPGASDYYTAYPTYYAFKLLKFFARDGDAIVQAASDNAQLSVFAAKPLSGTNILVINKDPANAKSVAFTLTGVNASTDNFVYSYGKANDDAARPGGNGCPDITRAPITVTGNTFTAIFEPYSMSVISLGSQQPALPDIQPIITSHPKAQPTSVGGSVTFTSSAIGCPAPVYRWQRALAGSSTFTDLVDGGAYAGTATGTLTVSGATAAMSGDQFRLFANVNGSTVQSNAAILTVTAAPTPNPPASGPSSGGGGGGGGLDAWMLAALLSLSFSRLSGRAVTRRGLSFAVARLRGDRFGA